MFVGQRPAAKVIKEPTRGRRREEGEREGDREEEKSGNYKKVTTAVKQTTACEGLVFDERADGGANEAAAGRRTSERERERGRRVRQRDLSPPPPSQRPCPQNYPDSSYKSSASNHRLTAEGAGEREAAETEGREAI